MIKNYLLKLSQNAIKNYASSKFIKIYKHSKYFCTSKQANSKLKQLEDEIRKNNYSYESVYSYAVQLYNQKKLILSQKHTKALLNSIQISSQPNPLISKIQDLHKTLHFKLSIPTSNSQTKQQNTNRYSIYKLIKRIIIITCIYQLYLHTRDTPLQGFIKMRDDADVQEEKNITVRFSDVIGIDQYKEELTQLIDYLKNPQKYIEVGAKLPKGILLTGAPGTGKTLLARALAGQAGCSFFYKSGAQFDQVLVGIGASRVRKLFKKAREKAPSIIFIDEIDSMAGKRSPMQSRFSRQTINQILAQMDGFKPTDNVIVIGATNLQNKIDPAIKRPGRFDKIIHIPLPDIRGREQLFKYYLKKIKFSDEVKENYLARRTIGFTGADVQNMVNISILNAIKNSRQIAEISDFQYAFDRISMGIGRKNMFVSQKDKVMTAYHQIGHAVASLLTKGAIPLHKVTILPTGPALGYTSMVPEKDNLNYTRRSIIANIDVCMGGRAAEQVFFGVDEITSGCSDDLNKATMMAYQFVKYLGMQEGLNLLCPGDIQTSDRFNEQIDKQVQKILSQSYNRVKKLIKQNEGPIKKVVQKLVKQQTMSVDQIKKFIKI